MAKPWEESLPVPAAQKARADWEAGKAHLLVVGLLGSHSRRIDPASGLYIGSLGCVASKSILAYRDEYNAQIHALLKEFGPPAWAPGRSLPDRERLLELMSDAHPVTTQEELDALKLGSLGYSFSPYDLVPAVVYRRLEDVGLLLLLGSDVTAMSGRIDVLDLRERRWMTSEEFDRMQVGLLPWDKLPREAKEAVRARHAAAEAAEAAAVARLRAEQEVRAQIAEANRQRLPGLLEKMKERDFACPHCGVKTRFRHLPKSECFVCLKCSRSSTALAIDGHAAAHP